MINFKKAAAGVLAAGMILSLTACDEESGTTVSGSGTSNAAPDANANAVVTTPLVTTTCVPVRTVHLSLCRAFPHRS